MLGLGFPYSPAQGGLTLFTVGVPTLFLTAWARPTAPDPHLLATLGRFVVPAAVLTAGGGVAVYAALYTTGAVGVHRRPASRPFVVAEFERYTGLTYGDAGLHRAAATIGAQTGLSTFVSLASILLILFLAPPTRLFAAWTRADRRQAAGRAGRRPARRRSSGRCSPRRCRTTSASPAPRRRSTPPCCRCSPSGSCCWAPPTGSGCSTASWASGDLGRSAAGLTQRAATGRVAPATRAS